VLKGIDRALALVMWVAAAVALIALFVGPELIGARKQTEVAAAAPKGAPSGKAVFASAGCAGCHTLAAAGASGQVGPNLDELKPDAATVEAVVTSGSGTMPSFKGKLSSEEIKAVAAFVAGEDAKPAATPAERGAPAVAKTIRVGKGPDGITVDGDEIVVADAAAGTLIRIRDDRPASPVPAGSQPDSPAVDGAVTWVVSSGDDAVRRIESGRTTTIRVGRAPESLAVGASSVWVTNAGDGTVTRIDKRTAEVVGKPIPVGGRPLDIAIADGVAWVTSFDDGTVTRIDTGVGKAIGEPIEVGGHPRGIAAGDVAVWVADASGDTVTRVAGNAAGDPIPVGDDPRELALSDGSLWVANSGDDTVTRIDARSGKVVGEPIEVGDDPIGIAAGAGAVWTANFRDGTVSKIVVAP
jgi:YVTN family beta-propeller protein